jgi:inorganic triphosphatase YgiF
VAEIELKFDLAPEAHAAFRRLPALAGAKARTSHVVTTYFDTPRFDLRDRQMALRLRRVGRRWAQTLKAGTPRDAPGRLAAGCTCGRSGSSTCRARRSTSRSSPARPSPPSPRSRRTWPSSSTVDMQRTTWQVEVSPGNLVEVALDRGEVRHGVRVEPISEVEIESLAGDALAVFELAERLSAGEDAPLLAPEHRHEGAARLRARARATAARFARPRSSSMPGSRRRKRRAPSRPPRSRSCRRTRRVSSRVKDPEYLHQYRVALRRLRSAIGVYRKAGGQIGAELREELRWIARLTGPARDWDVLVADSLPDLLAAYRAGRHARTTRARAAALRERAHLELRAAWLAALHEARAGARAVAGRAASRDRSTRASPSSRSASWRGGTSGSSPTRAASRPSRRSSVTPCASTRSACATRSRGSPRSSGAAAQGAPRGALGHPGRPRARQRRRGGGAPARGAGAPRGLAEFARGWFGALAHTSADGLERHAARLADLKTLKAKAPGATPA